MKKFLCLLFLMLFSSNGVRSQTAAETVGADTIPAEPSPVKISVPHSERTKGNILDSALDFIFVRFFKSIKDVDVDYSFFEINAQRDLVFKNFSVKLKRSDIRGTVAAQKIVINFSDFMKALQASKIETSQVILDKLSGDLNFAGRKKEVDENNPVQEKRRHLKFKAGQVIFKDVVWAFLENVSDSVTVVGSVSGENAAATLSGPEEKYAASSVEVKEIKVKDGKEFIFSKATVNGEECNTRAAFLKALKSNSERK
ncbi:hypothetical protein IKP13_09885 [bacterium]|nr:hypothetical protein [Alphaproteobacteria bacterium]MBR4490930.1 hypothetical protein [bacterium]